jgi:hypothetical protein
MGHLLTSAKKHPLISAICIFLIVMAILGIAENHNLQECINKRTAYDGYYNPSDKIGIALEFVIVRGVCGIRLIDHHSGFFTLLSAFVAAVFAFTLWRTTDEQVRLSRDEFNASHRPRLVVRAMTTITCQVNEALYLERRRRLGKN